MVVAVLIAFFKKQKSRTTSYRHYRKFTRELFCTELNEEPVKIDMNNAELKELTDQFLKFFNDHVSKNKNIRANNSNLIKITLTKINHA